MSSVAFCEKETISIETMLHNFCQIDVFDETLKFQKIIQTPKQQHVQSKSSKILKTLKTSNDLLHILYHSSSTSSIFIKVKEFLNIVNSYGSGNHSEIYMLLLNWIRRVTIDFLAVCSEKQFNIVVDFKELTITEAAKHTDFMKFLIDINLPSDRMDFCVLYNVPSSFRAVFNVIRPFMSQDTVSKLVIARKTFIPLKQSEMNKKESNEEETNEEEEKSGDETNEEIHNQNSKSIQNIFQNLQKLSK